MMRIQKIKASALQFAILVSVIIAILLASFLALTHTHRFFGLQSQLFLKTIENSQEGISFTLDPLNSINDSIELPDDIYSTVITKESWGGFLSVTSTSNAKTKSFTKKALIGELPAKSPVAVLLGESQLPLVLVGDTKITGDVYVSQKGVKAGIISGHYFNGDELVSGDIKVNDGKLPKLDSQWEKHTQILIEHFPFDQYEFIERQAENKNSFFAGTKLIYDKNTLLLNEIFIGNIIIKSDTEIIVSPFAKLLDVLLIAPKVTIQKGFSGNLHIIANEQIKLEENITLKYPSSLTLIGTDTASNEPLSQGSEPIYISENCTIFGNIIYLAKNAAENRSQTALSLQSNSTLIGHIYCQGSTEILGTVKGSVSTERFIYNGFGSRYINHIYDGKILANALPREFCGLPLDKKRKGVAQWLY